MVEDLSAYLGAGVGEAAQLNLQAGQARPGSCHAAPSTREHKQAGGFWSHAMCQCPDNVILVNLTLSILKHVNIATLQYFFFFVLVVKLYCRGVPHVEV